MSVSATSGNSFKSEESAVNAAAKNLTDAQSAFTDAVNTGDQGKIENAKMAYEQAMDNMQAVDGVFDALQKMMEQIIQSIGQLTQ